MTTYYGPTIKAIRLEKNLPQKEVYSGVVSRSFFSKFEKGKSDISISKFKVLLDNLSLTFEEFLYIHNGYKNDLDLIYNRIVFFWKENMFNDLLKLYQQYNDSPFKREHHFALLAYGLVFSVKKDTWALSSQPLIELQNYYAQKSIFTLREIEECRVFINLLSWEDTDKLINKALLSLKKYKQMDFNEYARSYSQWGLIKIQHLIRKDSLKEANEFMEDMRYEVDAANIPESYLNFKTAEIILGLYQDNHKWQSEGEEFIQVMNYLDPNSWTENIAIIQIYDKLGKSRQ